MCPGSLTARVHQQRHISVCRQKDAAHTSRTQVVRDNSREVTFWTCSHDQMLIYLFKPHYTFILLGAHAKCRMLMLWEYHV